MDADSFNDLALRVAAGEATADERRALDAELSAHPDRREEFEQIKITHDVLRTAAPMTSAASATEPELPAYRLNELKTAVRQHFGPATAKKKSNGVLNALRWVFAGGGLTILALLIVFINLSSQTIEVGVYRDSQVRADQAPLTPQDFPSAKLMTFDQDAAFDQFQNQSLAWYEKARIWVDNEHDLLHIVRRVDHGHVSIEAMPLAPTDEGQKQQIQQVIQSLRN
jgi:hypothetical protein